MRPAPESLTRVGDDEWVLRLIHPSWFDAAAAPEARLTLAALQASDYSPSATSYGASVYLESRLPGGKADLEACQAKWRTFGVSRVQARGFRALGVDVRETPLDCLFPAVAPAHASLLGVTKENRPRVVELLAQKIVQAPPPAVS